MIEVNKKLGMVKMITSVQNNQVKKWKKLHRKKYRTETGNFLIEGYHLIEEAYESDWHIEILIVREGKEAPDWMNKDRILYVTDRVFKEITQTEAPQGIAALVKMKTIEPKEQGEVLLIDAVQDPGNLGTIIRTADAAGFSQVILGRCTVDVYNDKVIRATQGSIFHIPIIEANLLEVIPTLQSANYTVLASALEGSIAYDTVDKIDNIALVMGNEGAGIAREILDIVDVRIKIPIYGKVESLNVSIAAGILMYALK